MPDWEPRNDQPIEVVLVFVSRSGRIRYVFDARFRHQHGVRKLSAFNGSSVVYDLFFITGDFVGRADLEKLFILLWWRMPRVDSRPRHPPLRTMHEQGGLSC